MKSPTRLFALLLSLTLLASAVFANTAVEPVPRDAGWVKRHDGFVAEAKQGGIDVLFLGDSITDFWRAENPQKGGKPVWDREFAPLHAANFGISADRTQHVLWRLQHGEGEGFSPKVIVLLIGTNNLGKERNSDKLRNTTPEAIEGVTAVVAELRKDFPTSKILFLAVFPRDDFGPEQRQAGDEANAALAKLGDGKHVFFLDIGAKFLGPDGLIPADVMPDKLHPSLKGYEIWAAAIKEQLAKLLK